MASEVRRRVAGHFGEFLQGCLGEGGPVALVTLPCPALWVEATMRPGDFALYPPDGPISRARLARLLMKLGPARGSFRLHARMPPGGGAGASTAALLAILDLIAPNMSPERKAQHCLEIEGATDPLMLPHPATHLWLPRVALSLASLPAPPAFDIVGGFHGPPMQTDAKDQDFADISDQLADWQRGCDTRDHGLLGQVATTSARRNHARRGGPDPAPLLAAARDLGAVGIVAAHTGSARGLIFRPGTVPADAEATLRKIGLTGVLRFRSPEGG